MFKDAFTKLDKSKAAQIISAANPLLDIKFDPDASQVMSHDLPFYPGCTLVEISRHDNNPPTVRNVVIDQNNQIIPLNWTNEPIFLLNEKTPILLNEVTKADYIRFFFHYVRGSHGRFLIVDTVDDIDWREEPAPAGRKALGQMIGPLSLKRKEEDGSDIFQSSMVFKDSLFSAEIILRPDGKITLQNEELLVEDIPVADDVFGQ